MRAEVPAFPSYSRWWYRDGTPVGYTADSTITVNQPGNYTMSVTNQCGSFLSDPVSVTVSTPVTIQPSLTTQDPTEYCGSGLFEMNVTPSGPGYTYDWYRDGALWYSTSSPTVSTGTEGTFYVEVNGNCESGTSNSLTVIFYNTRPSKPGAISGLTKVCPYQQGVVYNISPLQDASSYQWSVSGGGTITSGQGTNSVTVDFGKKIGNVSVKALNPCGSSRPSSLRVSKDNGCRIGELAGNLEGQNEQPISVLLYPNPASDRVNLRLENFNEQKISIVILNSLGQYVLKDEQHVDQNSVELNLSISTLEDGMYFLMVRAKSGTITRRLSVNRK